MYVSERWPYLMTLFFVALSYLGKRRRKLCHSVIVNMCWVMQSIRFFCELIVFCSSVITQFPASLVFRGKLWVGEGGNFRLRRTFDWHNSSSLQKGSIFRGNCYFSPRLGNTFCTAAHSKLTNSPEYFFFLFFVKIWETGVLLFSLVGTHFFLPASSSLLYCTTLGL